MQGDSWRTLVLPTAGFQRFRKFQGSNHSDSFLEGCNSYLKNIHKGKNIGTEEAGKRAGNSKNMKHVTGYHWGSINTKLET